MVTIYVTNANPSGPGSLAQALQTPHVTHIVVDPCVAGALLPVQQPRASGPPNGEVERSSRWP